MDSETVLPIPPTQPKPSFPWLILILSNLVSVLVGLSLAKVFLTPAPSQLAIPTPIPTITTPPTPEASNWQSYIFPQTGLQFSYPNSFDLKKSTNNSGSPTITLTEKVSLSTLTIYPQQLGIGLENPDLEVTPVEFIVPIPNGNKSKLFEKSTNKTSFIAVIEYPKPSQYAILANYDFPSDQVIDIANNTFDRILSTFKFTSTSSEELSSACLLKPETGNCKAYFTKFYYNQNEKKCKDFIWGGCGGVVPFQTLSECQISCT